MKGNNKLPAKFLDMLSRRKVAAIFMILMIPGYIFLVYALPPTLSVECGEANDSAARVTDQVGFCTKISVNVIRDYYFGTISLPVYRLGVSFDLVNRAFVPVLLLSAVLLWRESI